MYSKWNLALRYLEYFLSSSNGKGHGTHSPFIFQFISRVLNVKQQYPEYSRVEGLRQELLQDHSLLEIEDHGAGNSGNHQDRRTVAAIVKNAAKSKKYGQLLFRIAREYRPGTILELGTSLGVTTSYLSLANPEATIISLEGAGAVAGKARSNIEKLGIKNITVIEGNFDDKLPVILPGLAVIDLAFIDGNHRREPTERYFDQLLSRINNDSILVFDDIHWSREMELAWESIKTHPRTRCSIDLFFIGIVFFRQEFHEKQAFKIRF